MLALEIDVCIGDRIEYVPIQSKQETKNSTIRYIRQDKIHTVFIVNSHYCNMFGMKIKSSLQSYKLVHWVSKIIYLLHLFSTTRSYIIKNEYMNIESGG